MIATEPGIKHTMHIHSKNELGTCGDVDAQADHGCNDEDSGCRNETRRYDDNEDHGRD